MSGQAGYLEQWREAGLRRGRSEGEERAESHWNGSVIEIRNKDFQFIPNPHCRRAYAQGYRAGFQQGLSAGIDKLSGHLTCGEGSDTGFSHYLSDWWALKEASAKGQTGHVRLPSGLSVRLFNSGNQDQPATAPRRHGTGSRRAQSQPPSSRPASNYPSNSAPADAPQTHRALETRAVEKRHKAAAKPNPSITATPRDLFMFWGVILVGILFAAGALRACSEPEMKFPQKQQRAREFLESKP